MLVEADIELVTAAVDGELNPVRDAEFRRLLAESADAVSLYQALTRDRARIFALPRISAPADTAAAVFARLAMSQPNRRVASRRRFPAVPAGLAASFMVCAAGGSFWFYSSAPGRLQTAQTQSLPAVPPTETAALPAAVPPAPPVRETAPPPVRTPEVTPPTAPIPAPAPPRDVFASPPEAEVGPLAAADVRLPFLVPAADLGSDEAKTRVRQDLGRESAVRIDLFAADTVKAVETVLAAARTANVAVAVDPVTADRLQKKLPFAWVVFFDGLTPADAADLLAAVAKAAGDAPRAFGPAHMVAAGPAEQKDWKDLLGVEPAWAKKRTDSPAKPVSAATGDMLEAALTKSGSAAKPMKHALCLTYGPAAGRVHPLAVNEIRPFADRKSATTPLMIVVRPSNS